MSRKVIVSAACLVIGLVALFVWKGQPKKNSPAETSAPANSSAQSGAATTTDPMSEKIDDIVARYRKTIILLEDEDSLQEPQRERAGLIGKIIFQENHQAIAALSNDLTGEIETAGDFSKPLPQLGRFLDLVETEQDLHDGDKLAFRELFADVAESLASTKSGSTAKTDLEKRVDDDRKALVEIQSLYEKELDKIFGRFETRGIPVRREAWERYVAYLHTKYKREDIFKAYESIVARISANTKEGHRDSDLEIYGTQLPSKTFLLTFDDGPHARYTDRIVDILKKNGVKSVFFELGQNLGVLKQNTVRPTRAAAAARHVVEAGFAVGSHGFSHTLLPTMSDKEVAGEIDETTRMFESVLNVRTPLFRPPYGGRDAKILAAIEAHKMKSVLWNIDSRDWADPVAKSIANRVIGEARKYGHGIILLHDIHERTIDALPPIIETLKNEGYQFLAWNGETFASDATQNAAAVSGGAGAEPALNLYHDSWAVVVGVDNYPKWPRLRYAVNDANGMKEILLRKFGFKPDHVITLLNEDATREKILSVLGDTLSNPKKVQKDDRVVFFFAGHGVTRKLPSGRDLGYIIPFDAGAENFQGQAISMTNFQDISESIPAKHVLFIMDSCYSGLALTRGQSVNNYLREVSRRTARQMLTAGGADEEVADNGPNGHSVFTWTLLQGLEGRADLNSDGFISAAELASYVGPSVSALSHQTPAFGSLPGSEGGEFIFELHPETELLSEQSAQLDQEAIRLNAELDRIRKEIGDKTARNQKLKDQIASAKSEQAGVVAPPAAKVKDTAAVHLNRGQAFYKEKRYQEALNEFMTAVKLEPKNALAANNVGFIYYKMGNFDEALRWTEKATVLAPRRAIAYRNLGDLHYNLNHTEEARRAYEKFLALSPNNADAAIVRARLGK